MKYSYGFTHFVLIIIIVIGAIGGIVVYNAYKECLAVDGCGASYPNTPESTQQNLQTEESSELLSEKKILLSPPMDNGSQFQLEISQGWEVTSEEYSYPFGIKIEKDDYAFTISQPVISGGVCSFDDVYYEHEMALYYPDYYELQAGLGDMRIGILEDSTQKSYRVCQKNIERGFLDTETINYYYPATRVGDISFYTPKNPDPNILQEINAMILSIENLN